MDPRQAGLPFPRPQSQQTLRDPRYSSLPASQYASQPNTPRQDTLHKHDPFLRRKNDLDDARGASVLAQGPRQYGPPTTTHYPANHVMAVQDPIINNSQLRRNSLSFGPARMDRYGSQSSEGTDAREPIRPAQQSSSLLSSAPAYSFGAAQQTRGKHDSVQTPLLNHAPSPKPYAGIDYQPQPPSFTGRQMLPPSPQIPLAHQYVLPASSRAPTTSLPFSKGRDLPALSTTANHRPASSMSISSMLGSEIMKSSRESVPGSLANGQPSAISNLHSPTRPTNHANSPPAHGQGNGIFLERPNSPDRYIVSHAQAGRPYRSYSGGVEQRPHSFVQSGSSEVLGNESLRGASVSQYSASSIPGPHRPWISHQQRPSMNSGRPSSQPTGNITSPIDVDGNLRLGDAERARQQHAPRKHYIDLEEPNRDELMPPNGTTPADFRQSSQQQGQLPQSGRVGPVGPQHSPRQGNLNGSNQVYSSRTATEIEDPKQARHPQVHRPPEREQLSTSVTQSPYTAESLRRVREERQAVHQQDTTRSPIHQRARFINRIEDQPPPKYPGPPVKFADSSEPMIIDITEQPPNKEDTVTSNRSALATLIENSKRNGRFSPLPQAVQGAQARTSGPASDPGIQPEFSRMFSGIGSGVGSAGPAGSGTNTPFAPPSPTTNHEPLRRGPFSNRMDLAAASNPRTASKNSRRPRRAREDESKVELEDGEGGTPTNTIGRAAKRIKGNRHHHPYHLHHHRRHNVDDNEGGNEGAPPTSLNGKRVNTPLQSSLGSHRHHSHHHGIHHHHHHHQEPKPPRIPATVIKNDAVMERVRLYPREHLGTVLYSSILEPARKASDGAKAGYLSTPTPLPRYDGRENCTYTVRVPSLYLGTQEREETCRRRALWGTDIYTDDSDVIAASIHSGWIRGEFGEDFDFGLLELGKPSKPKSQGDRTTPTSQNTFTSPPDEPMVPPAGKELRLTLLVLPALENYTSHIAHGIKSRSWGNTHDGVSFRIEKMEWVNEKEDLREYRSGEARRKRIRDQYGGDGTMDGPPFRLDRTAMGYGSGVEMGANLVAVDA